MDFYTRKEKALQLIDKMLDEHEGETISGELVDKIEYAVSQRYAIGRPTIMRRIGLFKRLFHAKNEV